MPTCFINHRQRHDTLTPALEKKKNPGCIYKNCGPCRPPQAAIRATASLMCCQRHSDPSHRRPWTCQLAKALKMNQGFFFYLIKLLADCCGATTVFSVFFLLATITRKGSDRLLFLPLGGSKNQLWSHPSLNGIIFENEICSFLTRYLVNMFIKYTVHTSCIEWAISQTSHQIL